MQVSWCSGVFDNPLQVVCQMVSACLQSLEKDMSLCLSQHLETQDNLLLSVTQLKQVCYSHLLLYSFTTLHTL